MTSSRWVGRTLFDRPYLLLSFTSLTWAGNIVLGRFVAGHIPPIALNWLRWSGAFVILLPFAIGRLREDWPTIRAHLPLLALLAATGISAYNALGYYALQYTQALNGLLIQSTAPLLIALWALILFRDRLSWKQLAGILTSLCGVVIIVGRGDLAVLQSLALNPGDVWFFLAMVVYAFYSALLKRRPLMHPVSFLAVTMGLGVVLLTPALVAELAAGQTIHVDALTVATFGYVALFPSLLAYLCFNRGVELVGPNRAAPFFHLIPVFGSALAILFLGEEPRLYHAIGYALVLGGVIVATRRA
jgi:drug/metabolite transporter (DMT)-like permease